MCLQVSPRRRRFPRSTDMPFQADATRQRLTIPVKRDILYLVVVDDIRLRSRIRIRVELLLTCGASPRDHRRIDHLEIAVRLITPLDEESSVVQLGLRRPRNHHLTCLFITHRTEVGEFHRQRTARTETRRPDIVRRTVVTLRTDVRHLCETRL